MAKLGRDANVAYQEHPMTETWEPTMHLAFVAIDGKKVLHQQWRSNCGRSRWRPVVEIDPRSPDNE